MPNKLSKALKLVKVQVVKKFTDGWNPGDLVEIPSGKELDKLVKDKLVKKVK